GAYTIFYMGVNAGAFFGMMLCGYLAENKDWSWGFGLAGMFMLLGMLQFWLASSLFGNIGAKPSKVYALDALQGINTETDASSETNTEEKLNPFTTLDKILIVLSSVGGLLYLFNDPLEKIKGISLIPFEVAGLSGSSIVVLAALVLF